MHDMEYTNYTCECDRQSVQLEGSAESHVILQTNSLHSIHHALYIVLQIICCVSDWLVKSHFHSPLTLIEGAGPLYHTG